MAAMAFHVFQAHRRLRHHQPVRPENGRRPVIGQTLPFADQIPAHRLSDHSRRPHRLHLDALPDPSASGPASSSPWPSVPASTACAPSSSPPWMKSTSPAKSQALPCPWPPSSAICPAPSCTPSTAPSSIAIRASTATKSSSPS